MEAQHDVTWRAIYLLPLVAVVCACGLFQEDRCDFESEFIPGFEVTGLGLAANGRGYLSGIARFGQCTGTVESRFFRVDTNAQTAEAIATDYLLGKVLVAPDGERALAMGHKIPFAGVLGGVPFGALLIQGASTTSLDLDGAAHDIQPARDGWIASSLGGSWFVSFDGLMTRLTEAESRCGAEAGTWRVLCAGSEVKVLNSAGDVVASVLVASPALTASAAGDAVVVVHGTAATAVVSGVIGSAHFFGPAVGGEVWGAPGGLDAFVQTTYGTNWFRLDDGTIAPVGDNQYAVDVAFSSDGVFALVAYAQYGYSFVDLSSSETSADIAPNDTAAFELIGDRTFVLAGGKAMPVFRRGDIVSGVFQRIEIVSANEPVTRLATWDLLVE